jgi:hypothetical protein
MNTLARKKGIYLIELRDEFDHLLDVNKIVLH